MNDLENKSSLQAIVNRVNDYVDRYDSAIVITKYPTIDNSYSISEKYSLQNLAIQLVLRRYRNRVFEFQTFISDDEKYRYLRTIFVAVDTIGHKNLDRICPKIDTQFSTEISKRISSESDTNVLNLLQSFSVSDGNRFVEHPLSRYPTEIRTIWSQEQRLKHSVKYDI